MEQQKTYDAELYISRPSLDFSTFVVSKDCARLKLTHIELQALLKRYRFKILFTEENSKICIYARRTDYFDPDLFQIFTPAYQRLQEIHAELNLAMINSN